MLCSIDSCSRARYLKGFCESHYRKFRRHGDPLAGRRNSDLINERDDLGRKLCMMCEEWLPESSFQAREGKSADGLRNRCSRCLTDTKRGLTIGMRRAFLEAQGGACVCGLVFDVYGSDKSSRYCVDHDHACCPGERSCGDCIRGLLCNACNLVLGHADDRPDVLHGLIGYLARSA